MSTWARYASYHFFEGCFMRCREHYLRFVMLSKCVFKGVVVLMRVARRLITVIFRIARWII